MSKPLSYYLSTTIEPAATALQALEVNYGSYFEGFTLEEKKYLLALITIKSIGSRFALYRRTEIQEFYKRLGPAIADFYAVIDGGYGYNLAGFLLDQIQGH